MGKTFDRYEPHMEYEPPFLDDEELGDLLIGNGFSEALIQFSARVLRQKHPSSKALFIVAANLLANADPSGSDDNIKNAALVVFDRASDIAAESGSDSYLDALRYAEELMTKDAFSLLTAQVDPWVVVANPMRVARPIQTSRVEHNDPFQTPCPETDYFAYTEVANECVGIWHDPDNEMTWKFFLNLCPYERRQMLAVPYFGRDMRPSWNTLNQPQPQTLEEASLASMCGIVSRFGPGINAAYNLVGGGATIGRRHFHVRGSLNDGALPVDLSSWQHNGGDRAYPTTCLVSSTPTEVMNIDHRMSRYNETQRTGVSFPSYITAAFRIGDVALSDRTRTGLRIMTYPMRPSSARNTGGGFGAPASSELSGRLVAIDPTILDCISPGQIERQLSQCRISDEILAQIIN